MKKIFILLIFVVATVFMLSASSSATELHVDQNPVTAVPYASPTVDGNVNANEGYSSALDLSDTTCGNFWAHNPMSTQADLYYAYDDEGIYIAARVTEGLPAVDMAGTDVTGLNQFNYSTGTDDLDLSEEGVNEYGWDGDVMGIMLDPFGGFLFEDFTGGADHSAWYMVGLFEGDVARVYKSHTSTDGEITDQVVAAGKKTVEGWDFELMLPWDMIVADTDDCSMGFVDIDKETLVKEGTYLRVGAMYHDRFYDEEQGSVQTWGSYIVVPETLVDGHPGPGGVGNNIASYGIELVLGSVSGRVYIHDVHEGSWYYEAVHYCLDNNYMLINSPMYHYFKFSPDDSVSREAFVVILSKLANADLNGYTSSPFTDVKDYSYYAPAIAWAKDKGYVFGIGNGERFGLGRSITREEMAVILFRYEGAAYGSVPKIEEYEYILSEYKDVGEISGWARNACIWAITDKIYLSASKREKILAPKMTVTRAQAAQIVMNYDTRF